jgi:hypothetical protein
MPDLTLLLQHGILYGAILSVFMVLAFVGAAYLNPEMWLPDYPPDIRERFGLMSERAKRQRRLVGLPVFVLLSGVLVLSSVRLAQIGSESVFLATAIMGSTSGRSSEAWQGPSSGASWSQGW